MRFMINKSHAALDTVVTQMSFKYNKVVTVHILFYILKELGFSQRQNLFHINPLHLWQKASNKNLFFLSKCPHGKYGKNCSETCYCANKEACTSDQGICPGACGKDFKGPNCDTRNAFLYYFVHAWSSFRSLSLAFSENRCNQCIISASRANYRY